MSKSFKHILLIVAMLGMVLVGVAHANAPDHEISDCAICLYQPLADCHSTTLSVTIPSPNLIAEQPLAWSTPVVSSNRYTGYQGRAPPVSA